MSIVYIDQSKKEYTKAQFIRYFEAKAQRTIRKYNMLEKGDKILVAMSGGKDSVATAHIFNKILSKRGEKLQALLIDEGIPGYRDLTIKDAKKFCKDENIELTIVSTKKEFKFGLMDALKKLKDNPCTICGTMRRYLLNKYAQKLKATKVATGHNLDDEAQTVLMNQYKGNVSLSSKLGPITGIVEHEKFIKRIKPLYFLTEKEVTIYTTLKGFQVNFIECPNAKDNFRSTIRDQLNDLEHRFAGTKNGLINSFIEQLPKLRKTKLNAILNCKSCSEPSTKDICTMCIILKKYDSKV
ncbi:TIGR00269 family protein [Candidatus Woesearchaeota archaeon]|jgi:tRNA-5-methyluridine54 2-sulfurtransferase|nr:TIGR00269 family protein [Candidatus Woesearchaeota archaeon]MBT6401915.1 TIGR00269 family protein [Candidatus Woesearchaeota archaeon]